MLKLIIAALLSLSSLTAFADHHTEDAQEITKQEKANHNVKSAGNVIIFDDGFSEYTIRALIKKIDAAVEKGDKKIIIKLNSGGGSIFAGFKLIHRMLELQAQGIKFVGVVDRFCASMCFQSLQFMDVRLGYPFSMLLDHPASGGAQSTLSEISELLNINVINRLKAKGLSPIAIKLYKLAITTDFMFNVRTSIALGLLDKMILPGAEKNIIVKAPKVKKPVKK